MDIAASPDRDALERLASALSPLLPVSGDPSFVTVAAKLELDRPTSDDPQLLIQQAHGAGKLEDFVLTAIDHGLALRREAGEAIDRSEYGELAKAAEALGVHLPSLTAVIEPQTNDDQSRRKIRLLQAMFALYSDVLGGTEDDRLPKLANVIGGLLRANNVEVLRQPEASANDVRAVIRMGGVEYLLDLKWDLGNDPLAVDTTKESVRSLDRRVLLVAIQGFPRNLRPDPERDRRKVMFDGHDLTRLLEGRWTLPHAARWKAREQRERRSFARLPMAPPEGDPTAITLRSDVPGADEHAEDDAGRSVIAANVSEFDQTIAEEIEASVSEQRRIRRLTFALAGLVVAVLVGLLINSRVQDAITTAELEVIGNTALRAAQAQQTAYERLETTGLARYFDGPVIATIQAQVDDLRANGLYVTATLKREIVPEGSIIDGERAQIVFRETGVTELRGSGDGRILQSDPAHRIVHGYLLGKEESDNWLVLDWTIFEST